MSTRIYSYGARAPIEGADIVCDQLVQARVYQNNLVACERKLRDMEDRVVRAECPLDIVERAEEASFAVGALLRQARQERGDGRAPKRGVSPLSAAIDEARKVERAALEPLWAAEKAARKMPAVVAMIDSLREAAAEARRQLRAASGLYWGTYLLVEAAVDDASKKTRKEHSLPSFHAYDGGGRIGVQLQGGLSANEALACTDTRLRVQLLDEPTEPKVAKNGKVLPMRDPNSKRSARGRRRAIVWLRVGSEGRSPVWAKFPVMLHRPFPEGAVIKLAWAFARVVGPRIEWSVQFTLNIPDAPARDAGGPTVAVNLGWRALPDGGIRVGYYVGSDGREGEIRVPDSIALAIEHADSIRAIGDRNLNEMLGRVRAFAASDEAPDGLRLAVTHAHQWRSRSHLVELRARWGSVPGGAEGELVRALDAWIKQDRHLWFWDGDERLKAQRRRLDAYRCVAADLARRYAKAVITDVQSSKLTKQKAPEDGARSEGREQRVNHNVAAPFQLGEAVKGAFQQGACAKVKAIDATKTCPSCGVVAESAAPFQASIVVTCEACGESRDQDAAHCRRLLARASGGVAANVADPLAPSVAEGETVVTQGGGGRWSKRRSQRATKVNVPQVDI